jgi:hypothetical protein
MKGFFQRQRKNYFCEKSICFCHFLIPAGARTIDQ